MATDLLTRRALNRALLARQLLLRREPVKLLPAIERIGGIQAQLARPPFIGLWSRLDRFARTDLIAAVEKKQIMRATMMRATIHLMSRAQFVTYRPVLQGMLEKVMGKVLGERVAGIDRAALLDAAREHFNRKPCTFAELRDHLATRFPKVDERAMGYMVRTHLPLVQTPESGEAWGYASQADFAVAETWLGEPLPAPASEEAGIAALALLYLAAFGPARPQDFQSWSFLEPAQARAAFDQLRPKLATFTDERKKELFDLPKAPRPDAAVEAPVRLLPEFDGVLLAHADRTRVIDEEHRAKIVTRNLMVPSTVLIDGFVGGTWKIERKKKVATLAVAPFVKVTKGTRAEIEAEGERLLAFVEPEAEAAIEIAAPGK